MWTKQGRTKILFKILQKLCTYFAVLELFPHRQQGIPLSLEVRNLFIKSFYFTAIFANYVTNPTSGSGNGFSATKIPTANICTYKMRGQTTE